MISVFQALRLVNNRSLEEALGIVFSDTSFVPAESSTSTSGASIEQVTETPYESVGRIALLAKLLSNK